MAHTLYPFECRQAKLTYAGKFLVDIYFQYADGAPIREKFNFGHFPVSLKSPLRILWKKGCEWRSPAFELQNLPPTPFPSLPFIGHLYLFRAKEPLHRAFSKLSKRYGPVIFLQLGSRRTLLVSSTLIAEECFTKNDIIFANRPNLLNGKVFGDNYTSLPWSPYGDHWRNLRRISSLHLLSSHRIQTSSSIRSDESRIFIRKLIQFTNDNPKKAVNMKWVLFEFVFNVITTMIAGKNYKIDAEIFQEIVTEMSRVTMEANVVDFLPLMKWFGFKNTEKKLGLIQMKRDKFVQNIIEEHRRIELEEGKCKGEKYITSIARFAERGT
ncbi:Cytochrome [Forsythia ovata]|uniref:Cytochrome n=1 Tax=Forsythia ovata TaxID=205694 RepID=A0ABD1VEK8_9LAMI